jgi:hypothetical protein
MRSRREVVMSVFRGFGGGGYGRRRRFFFFRRRFFFFRRRGFGRRWY